METVFIKSDMQEKIRQDFSDSKFEDLWKNQTDGTHTPIYVKSEEIDIKCEPLETVRSTTSPWVVEDETEYSYIEIKKDIKNDCDSKNEYSQILTKVDELNSISNVEEIKSEEIVIKYEPLEDIRSSSIENGKTSFTCSRTLDEDIKAVDMLKYKDVTLVDGKTTASNFELKNRDDAAENVSANISKPPVYECNTCLHKTRRKADLLSHMLIHTDPSETAKYECNTCPYKTRWKSYLHKHMLVHTDPSITAKYKCDICGYKSRWKSALRSHMLAHANPSKRTIHKCDICRYKTQWKTALQSHMLNHVDPSKTPIYECNTCSYKTRWKSSLRSHNLVHADPSKTPMYECNVCSHKTHRKSNLQRHMLVHVDPSKSLMYECNTCWHKTRRKADMRRHMLVHKNSSRDTKV